MQIHNSLPADLAGLKNVNIPIPRISTHCRGLLSLPGVGRIGEQHDFHPDGAEAWAGSPGYGIGCAVRKESLVSC